MASKGPPGMLTRRSISRPDSSGGRKEIPLTSNSLDLLKPSPEQTTAGESRPSSAGPPRCKTPVGGAAPPRRGSSANRYANIQVLVQQTQQQQQHGGLPDDDSLVLYKDPSGLSMQQSVASVASGRHQEGETFFTALRRSFSSGSESELELQQAAAGGLSYVDSQVNPMCSPSTSAFFSARDERSGFYSAGGSLQDEYSQAASMATCESSSTLYQEASGAAAGSGLAPTASVLDVINSLYCSQATAGAAAQQQRKWQELDPDGRPLMQQHGTAAGEASQETQRSSSDNVGAVEAAMAAAHAEQSCASSVGSWDPTAAGQVASSADETAAEQQQQQQRAYAPSLSCAASATSAAGLAEPEASSSGASATADACSAADEQECQADAVATASDEAGTEDGAAEQPCDLQQQQQQGDGADIEAGDGGQAGAAACLAAVQQQLDSRLALQQELSGYVAGLAARLGDDGEQLVTLPADYQLMVERLLRERRSQYRALEGWEGPRRFDDLPVAQLPASHDDPKIAAGLEVIRQLDEQLKEAWIKAQVSARGSNPEQWAAAERERLAARAAQLDEALARERQKRLHAARLLRALHKLDEQQQANDALLLPGPCKGVSTYSYYKLQPQEEQLLAAVLGRDDAALEQHNPFDAFAACPDVEEGSVAAAAAANDVQDVSSGNAAPAALEASCCTAAAPTAGTMHVQSCGGGTGDAAGAQQQGPPAAADCCGSGRPSSEGSSRSVASSSSKPKHTLAEIDALLEALQVDHCAANGPGLGSSRPSIATLSSAPGSRRSTISKDATPAQAAAAAQRPRRSGAASASSVCSGASGQAQQQQQQQLDYVREQREAKELQQREQEVDAQLRALRTCELPATLQPEQLQALLQQCRQMQAAACSSAASLS